MIENISSSDPMISSVMYEHQAMTLSTDFKNIYAQYEQQTNEVSLMNLQHSPISESSEIDLGFPDSGSEGTCSSPGLSESPPTPPTPPSPEKHIPEATPDCAIMQAADHGLITSRYGPHEFFPKNQIWTLEDKATKLIEHSPCDKYTVQDLLNLTLLDKPDEKIGVLIEIVAKIRVPFIWQFVSPDELYRPYTTVSNCKKEKKKKDPNGTLIPKRPMNAFMIWCQKCRMLMSHICPQLHNAIISKALGKLWKTFSAQDKSVYEQQKKILDSFHKHEYPDYKYRPKKKVKKEDEQEAAAKLANVAVKAKSKKKKKRTNPVTSKPVPLKAINLAEIQQNICLDPMVKERLQVKMQVKIDPDFKREMGKRATGIDLADLSTLQTTFTMGHSPNNINYMEKSSVFDTPENSPHEPRAPSPQATNNELNSSAYTAAVAFKFDSSLPQENNNNNIVINNMENLNVKLEPGTLPSNLWQTRIIKTEPGLLQSTTAVTSLGLPILKPRQQQQQQILDMKQTMSQQLIQHGGMPILTAEYVDAVFEANDVKEEPMCGIEPVPDTSTNNMMDTSLLDFPDIMRFLHEAPGLDVEDLLKIESSSFVMEGPATV